MRYTRRTILSGLAVGFATAACGPRIIAGPDESAPAIQPLAPAGAGPEPCREPRAYVQFAINVHDTVHLDDSAQTLLRMMDLFERHQAAADFYLTGPMARLYATKSPEVLERLKASQMAISYHVRPPHPLYEGFDARLRGLSDAQLRQTLLDYETYGLDLATGELIRSEAGGYSYIAEALGRAPVVVGAPNGDQRIRAAALEVYRSLGAKMAVFFHEDGTKPDRPFEYRNGLLARPSDFSVTRWIAPTLTQKAGATTEPFWWNMLMGAHAAEYNPATYLRSRVAAWAEPRPALVTALIHENNLYRSGAEAWTLRYYSDTEKSSPLAPPYNMTARDPSTPRSAVEQNAIWAAYEELVACAGAEQRVVTSEDILALANASGGGATIAPACQVLARP